MPSAFSGNVQGAVDYLLDAMYPNYKGTVANFAALPATAQANDFYIVSDDGDGKSAGYVYSVIEGVTQWIKRYDVDYSAEGILAEAINRTQYMYVSKYGFSDHDQHGNPVTGIYAGQRVFGGDQSGQNLTFTANSNDLTGLLQSDNTFAPTQFNALDIGLATAKWRTGWFKTSIVVDTTSILPGQIQDTTGNFTFGALNLSTTGTLASGALTVQSTLQLTSGSVQDTSGAISFGSDNLTTTGTLTAASGSKLGDITFTNGKFSTASAAFDFSNKDLTNIGSISLNGNFSSQKVTTTELDVGSMILSGSLIKTTADATPLNLQGGTGSASSSVVVTSPLSAAMTFSVSGVSTFTGAANFNSTVNISPNFTLNSVSNAATLTSVGSLAFSAPTGIIFNNTVLPGTDASLDLGSTAKRFRNAYFSGGLSDGTNTVSMASLLSLRDINTNATTGMSLFYNGTEWIPSIPDTEIDHRTLSGLNVGDSGHPQFALLAGRTGGQLIYGGTASGENLTLDSTANATKGFVLTSSTFAPTNDSSVDLGVTTKQFRNVYTSGLFYGLRFDQYAGVANYPANASAKIGRVIWDTSANQLLVDNGTSWSKVGNQKWLSDVSFDGVTASQSVNVSASISDARTGVWQLADNTNNFERVQAKLTFTQNTVTISSSPPLPSGSYRLVGFN
jgi:hypothetical protein